MNGASPQEILREHFQLKETIVTIFARESGHIDAAKKAIRVQRADLEGFIRDDPFFQITLEPYDLKSAKVDAPRPSSGRWRRRAPSLASGPWRR